MDPLRPALKEQFHAGLAMLDECVARCPDDLWTAGTHPRTFWRIAFHAAFFTQVGLGQDEATYRPWIGHREDIGNGLDPASMEPYELPEEVPPYDPGQIRGYLAHLRDEVDPMIDALDLERAESGFSWYEGIGKLSHVLMTLRHLQGHVGQLSELLMARGIDIDWVARADALTRA